MPARLGLLLLLAVGALGQLPAEVVTLTDDTFEHDTQAATGQTTGRWAVLFFDSRVKQHQRAELAVQELANDDEKEVIYAQVDVAANPKVGRRFGDSILVPCLVLFRDRQMYVLDEAFAAEDIKQRIQAFVTSGFEGVQPLDVPEIRERVVDVGAFEKSMQMDPKVVGWAIAMIIGGLLFQTWAIINKDKFKPEPAEEAKRKASAEQQGEAAASKKGAAAPKAKGGKAKSKAA